MISFRERHYQPFSILTIYTIYSLAPIKRTDLIDFLFPPHLTIFLFFFTLFYIYNSIPHQLLTFSQQIQHTVFD